VDFPKSDIKEEFADVAVLYHVVFAFVTHQSFLASAGFAAVGDVVVIVDHLCADEAAFKVGVDQGRGPVI